MNSGKAERRKGGGGGVWIKAPAEWGQEGGAGIGVFSLSYRLKKRGRRGKDRSTTNNGNDIVVLTGAERCKRDCDDTRKPVHTSATATSKTNDLRPGNFRPQRQHAGSRTPTKEKKIGADRLKCRARLGSPPRPGRSSWGGAELRGMDAGPRQTEYSPTGGDPARAGQYTEKSEEGRTQINRANSFPLARCRRSGLQFDHPTVVRSELEGTS